MAAMGFVKGGRQYRDGGDECVELLKAFTQARAGFPLADLL
jgi:hypothetical protein